MPEGSCWLTRLTIGVRQATDWHLLIFNQAETRGGLSCKFALKEHLVKLVRMRIKETLNSDAGLWSYLSFGYLPTIDVTAPFSFLENSSAVVQHKVYTSKTVVAEAARVLQAATEPACLNDDNRSTHVVLLSGGLDSRAILGSLLKTIDRKRVVACTYGYSGNEELEIAKRVAKAAGVHHHTIFISQTNWDTQGLIDSAKTRHFPPSFVVGARFQNYRIYKEFGADCTFWDGILGDALTGAHLKHPSPFADWSEALDAFVRRNGVADPRLSPAAFDPRTVLPGQALCSAEDLAFDDQLDIAVRQSCYIANRIPASYRTVTPFSQETFSRFWLSLPRRLRWNQLVYKRALPIAFPKLFSLPVAGGRGRIGASRWQRRVDRLARRTSQRFGRAVGGPPLGLSNPHRRTGHEMRENVSLRGVLAENIADLSGRRLLTWLEPSRIWSDHLAGVADHTEALRVLVSLEIALKIADPH